jgi:sorting nexin-1/2
MDVEESPWADSASPSASEPPSQNPASQPSQSSTKSSTTLSTSRTSRATTPRRLVAQVTRLEASDDPLGPLGGGSDTDTDRGIKSPLSLSEGTPPVPPLKEASTPQQGQMRTTMGGAPMAVRKKPADPHPIDDGDDREGAGPDEDGSGGRVPPPVQVASPTVRTATAPSVSVEAAAKPTFYITVGDPHKVGDLTSSHIVYSVRTKVRLFRSHFFVAAFCLQLSWYLCNENKLG